jgi:hypothetical protein
VSPSVTSNDSGEEFGSGDFLMKKKFGRFKQLIKWHQEIQFYAIEFKERFGKWPNQIKLSEATLKRMHIVQAAKMGSSQFLMTDGFCTEDYKIRFYYTRSLSDRHFWMMYNEDK